MSEEKPREIAVRVLVARRQGKFVEELLDEAVQKTVLRAEDRRLLQELVYGVVRWELTLDWLIARKTGGKPQKPVVANLLRLALYQLFWLERIPSYAAVNESVEICKRSGLEREAKFVNAVLRAFARETDRVRAELEAARENNLALGFSHPKWLCERWVNRWGLAETKKLLQWNNSPPPLFARLNALKTSPDRLRRIWSEEGVDAIEKSWDWAPRAVIFEIREHPLPLSSLESFREGLYYVQDPSTLLAIEMLRPKPGETILDACAAPGGKSAYLAQLMSNTGEIIAEDPDPARLKLVTENARRLGTTAVRVGCVEGRIFDRVLVDAPCSNTGVMRRRIELRWRIQAGEIRRLAETQRRILDSSQRRLRPGGTLVYSTCSLEPEENQMVVREFLAAHPRFRLEAERQLTPMREGVDGAYCARLVLAE